MIGFLKLKYFFFPRYTNVPRENCLLCDRPYNLLDYYADLEPDRDFDIYSMSDDPKICREQSKEVRNNNARKTIYEFISLRHISIKLIIDCLC